MQLQCVIEDHLIDGYDPDDVQRQLRTGLILYRYLQAELSLGEVSELLGVTLEEALEWLAALGVPTARPMAPELEAESQRHAQHLLAQLDGSSG